MPTESDLEHLHAFAERYSETVFAEVHNLVKCIALRDVWKNAFGEEVYVDSITFDILYRTALEIFMADCALFAMETRLDCADPVEANSFDRCARKTIQRIKQLLPIFEYEHGPQCRRLIKFMKEEMKDYWTEN